MAVAADDVFVAGDFAESAGAAGVEAVGADSDFGTESEFATVVEAGAGIDDDSGGIDEEFEFSGGFEAAGDDCVSVC